MSCVLKRSGSDLVANEVMKMLPQELKDAWGVDDNNAEDVRDVISHEIRVYAGAVEGEQRDKRMVPENALAHIKEYMQASEESVNGLSTEEQYAAAAKWFEENQCAPISVFNVADLDKEDQAIIQLLAKTYSSVVECIKDNAANKYYLILKTPKAAKTVQEKALDKIKGLQGLGTWQFFEVINDSTGEVRYYKRNKEVPKGFRKTGRQKWLYNGQEIVAIGTRNDAFGYQPDPDMPVLTFPLGTCIDTLGRLFFDEESILWNKDGTLDLSDDTLKAVNEQLGNFFTLKGLKNILKDFSDLKDQILSQWDGAKIFSGKLSLFAKKTDEEEWIMGEPDLIIVDKSGMLHVVDIKTSILNKDSGGYNQFDSSKSEEYGKQISRYIAILRSHGFNVDPKCYIVQIDTWYNTSDHGEKNKDAQGKDVAGRKEVYKKVGDTWVVTEEGKEKTLSEYAEEKGNPGREETYQQMEDLVYMEPRLHTVHDNKSGTFLDTIAGLREVTQETGLSYEEQVELLSPEERAELETLTGKTVHKPLAQRTVTYTADNILSNPDLVGFTELQDLANFLMYTVSDLMRELSEGEEIEDIPLSGTALKGKSHQEIVQMVGLKTIIDYCFDLHFDYDSGFPTEEEYEKGADVEGGYDSDFYDFIDDKDYQKQKKENDTHKAKVEWITAHKQQFYNLGNNKLHSLEHMSVPVETGTNTEKIAQDAPNMSVPEDPSDINEDAGENRAMQEFMDQLMEGLSPAEAWMIGQRNYSPKASLAKEIKKLFETFVQKDANGETILDPYGFGMPMHIDATQAIQAVLTACKDCETIEEMLAALKVMAKNPQNAWINDLISTITDPENYNLKVKFFRHFRKDTLVYSISTAKFNKETGTRTVEVRVINTKSAQQTMMHSIGDSFLDGRVGTYEINGHLYSLTTREGTSHIFTPYLGKQTVGGVILQDIDALETAIKLLYKSWGGSVSERPAYIIDHLDDNTFEDLEDGERMKKLLKGDSIVGRLTKILHGIGIEVPESVVLDACLSDTKGEVSNKANTLRLMAKQVLNRLLDQNKEDGRLPESLAGNKAYGSYKDLTQILADTIQEPIEACSYQDGKMYYSYTNPSKLGHVVRNLKDALHTVEENGKIEGSKFGQYIEDNFGRYTGWYKTNDGRTWLNDLLRQLTDKKRGAAARRVLAHKVELAYLGKPYKELGELGFMLSILTNYFGTKDDESISKDARWFAVPTMSNKPTNEFIRMLKYKNPEEIIRKVLMPTFQQECNRIADVLFHFANFDGGVEDFDLTEKQLKNAGIKDIEAFKQRVRDHSLTMEDIIALTKTDSGAKFHFLWYLNSELTANPELAEILTNRINNRLTPNFQVDVEVETEENDFVQEVITDNMKRVVAAEMQKFENAGLFDTEEKTIGDKTITVLKYQDQFAGKLGSNNDVTQMRKAVEDFIWQDIAANINIIQITGGDLAYFKNAANYQKRIAQMHSPGTHCMHDERYDDGYLRSVHVSDMVIKSELAGIAEQSLREYLAQHRDEMSPAQIRDFENMIKVVLSQYEEVNVTDGQSYSSPTSMKKKLRQQGEWDDEKEKAYQKIVNGEFDINDLGIMLQPTKPFVTSDMAKYSGSPTMALRRVPLQDKNSEYLIILAEALARRSGKRSKLVAICDFMEETAKWGDGRQGIDTVHLHNVGKVGVSRVIDLDYFDKHYNEIYKEALESGELEKAISKDEEITPDTAYNYLLKEYMLEHIRPYNASKKSRQGENSYREQEQLVKDGKLKREEALYNSEYVDTIAVEDYIIQQEVPPHLLEHDRSLYGSQIRILGISDITPGSRFLIKGDTEERDGDDVIDEYKRLHAKNIQESYDALMKDLGLDKLYKSGMEFSGETLASMPPSKERDNVFKKLEALLQQELRRDSRYGHDVQEACSLLYDANTGHVIDFKVPLMDPIQSKRIQMLLNSIIKKAINKQRINGGPVVQTTAYDNDLSVRFKDKNGNILDSLTEFKKKATEQWKAQHPDSALPSDWDDRVVNAFKEYLRQNGASIAYFECYVTVPNQQLESLLRKEDGTMMSFEEAKEALPPDVFESLTEMIGYRIPTEDKYSMVPLKIVGFLPKAAGQVVMMPKEITLLTGSDFDIDKMYLMLKSFRIKENTVNPMDYPHTKTRVSNTMVRMMQHNTGARSFEDIAKVVQQNANKMLKGDPNVMLSDGLTEKEKKQHADFIEWYRRKLLASVFEEYKDQESTHAKERKRARDNRLLDIQWAVLTHPDTLSKMLNPGNFEEIKKVGRIINVIKSKIKNASDQLYTWDELEKLYDEQGIKGLDRLLENADPHNTTLPSSKLYFQKQNMQGTQLVGSIANNNVSHAFCSFQKIGIDLTKGKEDKSFYFCGLGVGTLDDFGYPTIVLDRQTGHDGTLISKTLARCLAAAVDTAKDPSLSDLNINPFTIGVAMTLARMGFSITEIGRFLSQPVIVDLTNLYFRNQIDRFYDGTVAVRDQIKAMGMKPEDLNNINDIQDASTITLENLTENLTSTDYKTNKAQKDYQLAVLKAFNQLLKMSVDLRKLTMCTKFNSVSNAVGPTIADSEEMQAKVDEFMGSLDTSCFYMPEETDQYDFTNPADIITNDPILKAFYETTYGVDGASRRIFGLFFPHYFRGFRNVLETFQEKYIKGKRVSAKQYNKLLDDYLYFLLTYSGVIETGREQDPNNPDRQIRTRQNFAPTLPYKHKDLQYLTVDLVERYKDVLNLAKKMSKPNMLLDQTIGNTALRIREKDEYVKQDMLYFNSSQLDSELQEKVKNAWSDLITMNDPALTPQENALIKRFAVDLFFYSLMRNGFGFNAKTLMHLASVIVKYNATYDRGYNNYILGLRNLHEADKYLMGDKIGSQPFIERFLDQFFRNNLNSTSIIPTIEESKKIILGKTKDAEGRITTATFAAKKSDSHKLYSIKLDNNHPRKFIVVLTKNKDGKLIKNLLKLNEGYDTFSEDGEYLVAKYTRVSTLGIFGEFKEYSANEDLEKSFFEESRSDYDEADEDAQISEDDTQTDDEIEEQAGGTGTDEEDNWAEINRVLTNMNNAEAQDRKNLRKFKQAYQESQRKKTEVGTKFRELMDSLVKKDMDEDEQNSVFDQIKEVYEDYNRCNK